MKMYYDTLKTVADNVLKNKIRFKSRSMLMNKTYWKVTKHA